MRDRMNRESNNYELQMETNFDYNNHIDLDKKKFAQKITPAIQVERIKVIIKFFKSPF
jgi:hypothetical protein